MVSIIIIINKSDRKKEYAFLATNDLALVLNISSLFNNKDSKPCDKRFKETKQKTTLREGEIFKTSSTSFICGMTGLVRNGKAFTNKLKIFRVREIEGIIASKIK